MDDEMMNCGSSRVGGFMELLGFHQHFIPPNFSSSSSSSISTTTCNNSSSIPILDQHHHHHHQGPNDLVSLPQNDHDQYSSFKDHELIINYSYVINYEELQQQKATPPPNSCTEISSESSAGDGALTSDATRPLDDNEEQQSHPYDTSIQKLKVKRKSNEMKNSKGVQKKQERQQNKEARVAFMTRSKVDQLEDGFRWRKYGQKAVKNSPFPRSYYRCTDAACNVKKRVERSLNDPTVVVTTYEGKHTHPSPIVMHHHHAPSLATLPPPFTASSFASPPQITIPQNHHQIFPHFGMRDIGKNNNMLTSTSTHDHGLLQDIVLCLEKKE